MFFFNETRPTELSPYCHTLSLLDALPILVADACGNLTPGRRHDSHGEHGEQRALVGDAGGTAPRTGGDRCRGIGARPCAGGTEPPGGMRSEEHTSELQSLMRISYAVFCLKKKTRTITTNN